MPQFPSSVNNQFSRRTAYVQMMVVTIIVGFLMLIFCSIAMSLVSEFNPMARSLSNFSVTDVFYQIDSSSEKADTSELVTLVDMTEVYDRQELATIIDEIRLLNPAVLGIDIVFESVGSAFSNGISIISNTISSYNSFISDVENSNDI